MRNLIMGSSTATQIKTNDINEHNFTSTQRDHILSKNDVNIWTVQYRDQWMHVVNWVVVMKVESVG